MTYNHNYITKRYPVVNLCATRITHHQSNDFRPIHSQDDGTCVVSYSLPMERPDET